MRCAGRRRPPSKFFFARSNTSNASVPYIYLRIRADVQLFANGRPDYPQAYVRRFTNPSLIDRKLIGTILRTGARMTHDGDARFGTERPMDRG